MPRGRGQQPAQGYQSYRGAGGRGYGTGYGQPMGRGQAVYAVETQQPLALTYAQAAAGPPTEGQFGSQQDSDWTSMQDFQ